MNKIKHYFKPFLLVPLLLLLSSLAIYGKTFPSITPQINLSYDSSAFFLKSDGTLWVVNGRFTNADVLTTTYITKDVTQVAGRIDQGLFLKRDGSVWSISVNENLTFKMQQIHSNAQAVYAKDDHYMVLKNDHTLCLWEISTSTLPPLVLTTNVCCADLMPGGAIIHKMDDSLWGYTDLNTYFNESSHPTPPCLKLADHILSYHSSSGDVTYITPRNELYYWHYTFWDTPRKPKLVDTAVKDCRLPLILKTNSKLYLLDNPYSDTLQFQFVSDDVVKINPSLAPRIFDSCTFVKKDATLWAYNPCGTSSTPNVTKLSNDVENMGFNSDKGLVALKDGSLWFFGGKLDLDSPDATLIPSFTLPNYWSGFNTCILGVPIASDFSTTSTTVIPSHKKIIGYELLPLWVSEKIQAGFELSDVILLPDSSFTIAFNALISQVDHSELPYTFSGKNGKITRITFAFPCQSASYIARSTIPQKEYQKDALTSFTKFEPLLSSLSGQTIQLTAAEKAKFVDASINQTNYRIKKPGYTLSTVLDPNDTFYGYVYAAIDLEESIALPLPDISFSLPNENIDLTHLTQLGFNSSQVYRNFSTSYGYLLTTSLYGEKSYSNTPATQMTRLEFNRPIDQPKQLSCGATWTINQEYFISNGAAYIAEIKNDVLQINSLINSTASKQDLNDVLTQLQQWAATADLSFYDEKPFMIPSSFLEPSPYDYSLLLATPHNADHTITIELFW